jgi:hypothetical protein
MSMTRTAQAESRRWPGLLHFAVPAAVLLALYCFNVFQLSQWYEAEIPTGPDQLCYLRQAQLFEQKGSIGGLDTAMRFEGARYLVAKAKALGFLAFPEPSWIASIAPECHRYKAATDQIISQYPPGTGFFLSFFHETHRVRAFYIAIETAVLAWFVWLIFTARSAAAAWLFGAFGSFLVIQINYEGYMSFSLPLSMLLCAVLGHCTVALLLSRDTRKRVLIAAACGLLLGVLVSLRIANILLSGGFFLAFADMYLRKRDRGIFPAAVAFALAFAIALVPNLAANAINAGSPLATTYGGEDAASPVFSWQQIAAALDYYFIGEGIGYVFDVGLAGILVFEIGRRWLRLKSIPYVSFINTATWLIAAAYYLTHSILNSYYLIATATFSLALLVFGAAEILRMHAADENTARRAASPGIAAGIAAAGLALFAVILWRLDDAPKLPPASQPFEASAIIWADQSAGLFGYYLQRHAAAIDNTSRLFQDKMIDAVASDGRAQYFIADNKKMQALIERIPGIRPAADTFGYKTYRLAPR